MTLEQAQLDLALKITNHAFRSTRGIDAAERTEAFRAAYAGIAPLGAASDDWSIQALDAAWELVREAYPTGGPVGALVADVASAYAAIASTVRPPGGPKRGKPRKG